MVEYGQGTGTCSIRGNQMGHVISLKHKPSTSPTPQYDSYNMVIFVPYYPPCSPHVLEEMCTGACNSLVWLMAIPPTHPIITAHEPFSIRFPELNRMVHVQLGPWFQADDRHIIYSLHPRHTCCPEFIAIATDNTPVTTRLTILIPTLDTDPNLMITYIS